MSLNYTVSTTQWPPWRLQNYFMSLIFSCKFLVSGIIFRSSFILSLYAFYVSFPSTSLLWLCSTSFVKKVQKTYLYICHCFTGSWLRIFPWRDRSFRGIPQFLTSDNNTPIVGLENRYLTVNWESLRTGTKGRSILVTRRYL